MMQPFNEATRQNIAKRCAAFARLEGGDMTGLKRAAVAIALVDAGDSSGGTALLLTLRASSLRAHSSQWALPGGRCDADETPVAGALRELHEELGLDLRRLGGAHVPASVTTAPAAAKPASRADITRHRSRVELA